MRVFSRILLRGEALPLVLSSSLAMLLLAARIAWTGHREYSFLAWNLFLAWTPFAIAAAIRVLHTRRASALVLAPAFALWLGFLPNAPYLVTDFIHLRWRDTAPVWFDATMLASFAWAGVGLGSASLRSCAHVVRVRHGQLAAWAFVPVVAVLTGFGVYLGRFVRLNSWDVALRPATVVAQVVSPLAHPFLNMRAWTVTLTIAAFFCVAHLARGIRVAARR
jgi:uncharacterized membrane protein